MPLFHFHTICKLVLHLLFNFDCRGKLLYFWSNLESLRTSRKFHDGGGVGKNVSECLYTCRENWETTRCLHKSTFYRVVGVSTVLRIISWYLSMVGSTWCIVLPKLCDPHTVLWPTQWVVWCGCLGRPGLSGVVLTPPNWKNKLLLINI